MVWLAVFTGFRLLGALREKTGRFDPAVNTLGVCLMLGIRTLILTGIVAGLFAATSSAQLYDNKSVNGTKLDGRKLECETPLRDGQVIRAGSIWMRFSHVPDEDGHVPPPITFDPTWLTANDRAVPRLAETVLEESNFELLPLLADALEDAGCHDVEVLEHCRHAGHRAGQCATCWLLDLIVPPSARPVVREEGDDSTVMKVLPWSPQVDE